MNQNRRILLVDDNPQYRSAVTRNLTMADYDVIEAGDSVEGMEKVQKENPQVIITDLDMRTHDEGLQFIRDVKRQYPHMPIIMISAVGTFDEGALARQYGAMFVMSKSRIDAEISTLYQQLDSIFCILQHISQLQEQLEDALQSDSPDLEGLQKELNDLLQDQDLDPGFKSRVYELLDKIERYESKTPQSAEGLNLETALESVSRDLPEINDLDQETQTMLSVAESMQISSSSTTLSIARNVSFSYSFAVENEVKIRIGRKVNRIIASSKMQQLADQLYDISLNNLDIFFNQYLIRIVQKDDLELNSDITRQVLERIIQHGSKYKPDGLKALGVILFCWGRNHEFTNRKGKVKIQNPLGLKGITDEMTTQLASELILLQHLRNPFIHPEFNEREKTESLRNIAFSCLSIVSKVV